MNQELEIGAEFGTLDDQLAETPLADVPEKLIAISKRLHAEHAKVEENSQRTLSELTLFDRKASLLGKHITYVNQLRDKLQSGYQQLVNAEGQLLNDDKEELPSPEESSRRGSDRRESSGKESGRRESSGKKSSRKESIGKEPSKEEPSKSATKRGDSKTKDLKSPSRESSGEGTSRKSPSKGSIKEGTSKKSPSKGSIKEGSSKKSPSKGSIKEEPSKKSPSKGSIKESSSKESLSKRSPSKEGPSKSETKGENKRSSSKKPSSKQPSGNQPSSKAVPRKPSELLSNLVGLDQKEFVVYLKKILGPDISAMDWKRILCIYSAMKEPLKKQSVKIIKDLLTKPVKQELDAFVALIKQIEQRNGAKFVSLKSLLNQIRANQLDESRYPAVTGTPTSDPAKLLIFVCGGISFNELSVVKTNPNTTLISDCILYPKNFFLDGLLGKVG